MKLISFIEIFLMLFFISKAAIANPDKEIEMKINRCNAYMQQRNYEAALNCYKPFAEQGENHAQFNVGMIHANGLGVPKDLSKAFYWYQKSAKQGFSFAQAKLGEMYAFGVGTAQNCKQAIYWLNKAITQNNIWAFEDFSHMYEYGTCVKKDKNKALYWRQKWQSAQKQS